MVACFELVKLGLMVTALELAEAMAAAVVLGCAGVAAGVSMVS